MNTLLQHLDDIDGPKTDEVERIRRRLSARRPRVTAVLVPTGLAMAAAAALMLGALPSAALPGPPPVSVSAELTQAGAVALTEHIRLDIDGLGTVHGDANEVDIDWKQGSLSVTVTPDQGIDLTVRTDEASASVVGTTFSVDRSALGTAVLVTEGTVSVECADMTRHTLTAGNTALCLPLSAIGRVVTLLDTNAPSQAVLAEIQRGLSMDPPRSIRGELLSRQIEVLLEQGDRDAAAAVAWHYIHEGHTARAEKFTALAQEAHP
ncbi:MAG: ferric-dicitrate binding protein FerR (iron transport regulator) [Myxococcota bacterium]